MVEAIMAKMTLEKFMRQGNNGVLSKDYNTDVQGADVQSPVNDPGFLEYLRSKAAGNFEASLGGAMRFAGQIADTVAPNADSSDGFLANNGKYLENLGRENLEMYKPQTQGYEDMDLVDRLRYGTIRDIAGDVAEGVGSSLPTLLTALVPGGLVARGALAAGSKLPMAAKIGTELANLATKYPKAFEMAQKAGSTLDNFSTRYGVLNGAFEAMGDAGSNIDEFKKQGMSNDEVTKNMVGLAFNEMPYLMAASKLQGKLFEGTGGLGPWKNSASMAKRGVANLAGVGAEMGAEGYTELAQNQLADKWVTGEDRGMTETSAWLYNMLTGNNITGPNQADDVAFAKGALGGLIGVPGGIYGTVRQPRDMNEPILPPEQSQDNTQPADDVPNNTPVNAPPNEPPPVQDDIASRLEEGFQDWEGKRMPNGGNGCVDAVVRIGSHYNDWLAGQYNDGVSYAPTLLQNALNDGIEVIDFDPAQLEVGDVIVYDKPNDRYDPNVPDSGNNHVMLWDGKNRVGNSTSREQVYRDEGYNISGLIPARIIKTGNGQAPLDSYDFTGSYSGDDEIDAYINKYAEKYDVDPALVAGVMNVESTFNRDVGESSAGAIGLMQLMPATASSLGVDPYDMEQNIEGGVKELRRLLDKYNGDMELTLAAYNAGEGRVQQYNGVPPFAETQKYIPKVMEYFNKHSKGKGKHGNKPANNPQITSDINLGDGYEDISAELNNAANMSGYDKIISDLLNSNPASSDIATAIDNASNDSIFNAANQVVNEASNAQQDTLANTVDEMYENGDAEGLRDFFKRMAPAITARNNQPSTQTDTQQDNQPIPRFPTNRNRMNFKDFKVDWETRNTANNSTNNNQSSDIQSDSIQPDNNQTDNIQPSNLPPIAPQDNQQDNTNPNQPAIPQTPEDNVISAGEKAIQLMNIADRLGVNYDKTKLLNLLRYARTSQDMQAINNFSDYLTREISKNGIDISSLLNPSVTLSEPNNVIDNEQGEPPNIQPNIPQGELPNNIPTNPPANLPSTQQETTQQENTPATNAPANNVNDTANDTNDTNNAEPQLTPEQQELENLRTEGRANLENAKNLGLPLDFNKIEKALNGNNKNNIKGVNNVLKKYIHKNIEKTEFWNSLNDTEKDFMRDLDWFDDYGVAFNDVVDSLKKDNENLVSGIVKYMRDRMAQKGNEYGANVFAERELSDMGYTAQEAGNMAYERNYSNNDEWYLNLPADIKTACQYLVKNGQRQEKEIPAGTNSQTVKAIDRNNRKVNEYFSDMAKSWLRDGGYRDNRSGQTYVVPEMSEMYKETEDAINGLEIIREKAEKYEGFRIPEKDRDSSKQSEKPVLSPEEQALNKYSAKIYAKEVGKEILKQDKKGKLDEEALDMAVYEQTRQQEDNVSDNVSEPQQEDTNNNEPPAPARKRSASRNVALEATNKKEDENSIDNYEEKDNNNNIEFDGDTTISQRVFDTYLNDELKKVVREQVSKEIEENIDNFEKLLDPVEMDRSFAKLPSINRMRTWFNTNSVQKNPNYKDRLAAKYEYARRCFLNDKRITNGLIRQADNGNQQGGVFGTPTQSVSGYDNGGTGQITQGVKPSVIPTQGEYKNIKLHFDKLIEDMQKKMETENNQVRHSADMQGASFNAELDELPKIPRNKQTVTEKLLSDFCDKFGIKLNIVDNKTDIGNRGLFIADGQIFLNRSANVPLRNIFWHEFTHWLKVENPSAYSAMENAVRDTITPTRIKRYRNEVAGGQFLSDEDVIEEMIADGVAKSNMRKQLMQAVIDSNPSRAKRILGNLWNMFYNLQDMFRTALNKSPNTALPQGLNGAEMKKLEGEIKRAMGQLVDKNGKPVFNNQNINDYVQKQSASDNNKPLAPNGKPSNLTKSQWQEVRTPAFKRWFGDWENDPANASKIVDENGEPLVVYHGTATDNLEVFNARKAQDKTGRMMALGLGKGKFYFIDNEFGAQSAANSARDRRQGKNPQVLSVYLNVKNPIL